MTSGGDQSWDFAQGLVSAMARGDGVAGAVRQLRRRLGASVGVLDLRGSVLLQAPDRESWPTKEILAAEGHTRRLDSVGVCVAAVELEGETVATLATMADSDCLPLLRMGADVIAMEMARLHALATGRRELVGRLLSDIVTGAIPDAEAAQRVAQFGIDGQNVNFVVLGQVDAPQDRLERYPWNLHALMRQRNEPYLRATIGDRLVLVVPSAAEVAAVAQHALRHLSRLGPRARVGISGSHSGIRGIRIGYYEAIDGLQLGTGINHQTRLNIGHALIASNLELPMFELADAALAPIVAHDERHSTDLLETLQTYLLCDCSVVETAKLLYIHRNTLRYRLTLIGKLTGRDVFSTGAQVHFWLAMQVRHRHS
jgi:sugar diacid utilization regulator